MELLPTSLQGASQLKASINILGLGEDENPRPQL